MTNPEPGRIALAAITPSTTNPRRHFNQAALDELTQSVKKYDVLQPILVRPNGGEGTYELVAGERRYRAAVAAGLDTIPARVKELTDTEVLEVQVIENLQRSDLQPLEEAEGYERLMKCTQASGEPYTVEEISQKVGKSKGYVYAKIKLLDLCESGRAALADGKIGETIAVVIARIPSPKLQAKAVKDIVEPEYEDQPMSFRDAKAHVESHYMLRLKEAPFKASDAGLVPDAGACTTCQKRTGNQPELFSDIASADVCTDPPCFERKRAAYAQRKAEEAIAAGRTVITGKEAKKIMPNTYSSPKGYVRLDAACYEDPKNRNYRALVGKAAKEAVLIEKPGEPGEFVEALPVAVVAQALKDKGYDFVQDREAQSRDRSKEQLENEIERETRARVYLALRQSITQNGFTAADLRQLIVSLVCSYRGEAPCDLLVSLWGVSAEDQENPAFDLTKAIEDAPDRALLAMLLDALIEDPEYQDRGWERMPAAHGIDEKAIRRDVKAEIKAKAKAQRTEAETETEGA